MHKGTSIFNLLRFTLQKKRNEFQNPIIHLIQLISMYLLDSFGLDNLENGLCGSILDFDPLLV